MVTTINLQNIIKVELIPFDNSKEYIWFDKRKGIFSKPSGIYYVKNGVPLFCCGVIATNYDEAIKYLSYNKYKIIKNDFDKSLIVYEYAHIKIYYIGCEYPECFYFKDNKEAQEKYNLIIDKIKDKIEF